MNSFPADLESRKQSENTEWGLPEIDLFASNTTKKYRSYACWLPDKNVTFIDAFCIKWNVFKLSHIFPPFRLLPKCLQKINAESATAIVIVPAWRGQPWFPTFMAMAKENQFPTSQRKSVHPKDNKRKKVTGYRVDCRSMLSRRVQRYKFSKKAMDLYLNAWDEKPKENTMYISKNALFFAQRKGKIHLNVYYAQVFHFWWECLKMSMHTVP